MKLSDGMKKYHNFVKHTLGHNKVMTPHSKVLEVLGLLEVDDDNFIGLALKELSQNFENDYYLRVDENKLYKIWKSEEKELYQGKE